MGFNFTEDPTSLARDNILLIIKIRDLEAKKIIKFYAQDCGLKIYGKSDRKMFFESGGRLTVKPCLVQYPAFTTDCLVYGWVISGFSNSSPLLSMSLSPCDCIKNSVIIKKCKITNEMRLFVFAPKSLKLLLERLNCFVSFLWETKKNYSMQDWSLK